VYVPYSMVVDYVHVTVVLLHRHAGWLASQQRTIVTAQAKQGLPQSVSQKRLLLAQYGKKKNKWYKGFGRTTDGTFKIEFDDGDTSRAKPEAKIRLTAAAPTGAPPRQHFVASSPS
jgi:hypothetical protein